MRTGSIRAGVSGGLFLLLAGVWGVSSPAADDAVSTRTPQIVILKLDDIAYWISPQWKRTADYLREQNIKSAFGVITEGLERAGPETIAWIQEQRKDGMVEFWHHGYKLRNASDTGEFEQGSVDDQRAILEKGQAVAREKLGFEFAAFGPHWSGTTDETEQAVEQVPSIKIWLYGPVNAKHYTRLSLHRFLALENPTFVPDPEKFKAGYERVGRNQPVLVLQGHPNAWGDDTRWNGFLEIIAFLRDQGCVFMTPSEYLEHIRSAR